MASPKSSKEPKWLKSSSKSFKISFQRFRPTSIFRQSSRRSPTSPPFSPHNPKTTTREEELKQVYRRFDSDGDGKISALELRAYFASVGEYMSHEDARGVINELDTDGDDMLDFDDFLRLMNRESNDDDDGLKKAFEMFELDKGDGCITPTGLQRMLQRLGDDKSYDECVAMIQVYDIDGNGVVDFHEFNQMMA
ncbi:hypothetical protein SLA2020_133070 [Shorea laevis]